MNLLSECPTVQSWKRFLTEALPGDIREKLAQHLDACSRCQAAVERQCRGTATWLEVAKRWRHGSPALAPAPDKPAQNGAKPAKPSIFHRRQKQGVQLMIVYTCPRCQTTHSAPQDQAGSKHECPCGQRLQIPESLSNPQANKTVLGTRVPEKKTILAAESPKPASPGTERRARFSPAVLVSGGLVLGVLLAGAVFLLARSGGNPVGSGPLNPGQSQGQPAPALASSGSVPPKPANSGPSQQQFGQQPREQQQREASGRDARQIREQIEKRAKIDALEAMRKARPDRLISEFTVKDLAVIEKTGTAEYSFEFGPGAFEFGPGTKAPTIPTWNLEEDKWYVAKMVVTIKSDVVGYGNITTHIVELVYDPDGQYEGLKSVKDITNFGITIPK